MTERKPLSKKVRFEIFKRDGFACQYCGKTPPDVILEVDHIMPVVNGGDNDYSNLITSCFDCNRGKGKREIGNISPRPDADLVWLETQQEIAELRRYQSAKEERDRLYDEIAESFQDTWMYAFQTSYAPRQIDFIRIAKSISPEIIEQAIYIASGKKELSTNTYQRFKYMCGIAWNLVKENEDGE